MSDAVPFNAIRNEEDFDATRERIAKLMTVSPGSPEEDELDILLTLAQAYEHEHYPVGPTNPIEAVKLAMDRLGLSQKDLAPYFGAESRVSEFLHGKRSLTVGMIRQLHKVLGIPAEFLLG